MKQENVLVTLSRQVGAGGAPIGRKVATRLGFKYIDREILGLAARQVWQDEKTLQNREEKLSGMWENLLQVFSIGTPEAAYPLPGACQIITDRQLFDLEADAIRQVAAEFDAVIVGRAGFWVLQDHPGLVSIFLHADREYRAEAIRRHLHIPTLPEALELLQSLDRQREKFIRTMTGVHWREPGHFHLCIDTGRIPEDAVVDMIVRAAEAVREKIPKTNRVALP
ncbi:MAG: cytidylate kinase-like family protein [Desulfuromonadales bacterium]